MRLSTVTATVVLTIATVVAAPQLTSPARADVGCRSETCDHKDPEQMGCAADAITYSYQASGSSEVQLRFSVACNAAWARLYMYGIPTPQRLEARRYICESCSDISNVSDTAAVYATGSGAWTDMLSVSYGWIAACLPDWHNANGTVGLCTGSR